MKNKLIILSLLLSLFACKEEQYSYDTNAPLISLEKESDQWVPGREYTISANIKDDTGLKNILIKNDDLILDESINFGRGLVKDFNLTYPFDVPENLPESGSYEIKIAAVDVAGNISDVCMKLSLDGDIDAPVFVTAPQKRVDLVSKPDLIYKFEFDLKDNKGLNEFTIECKELNINETIDLGGQRICSMEKEFSFITVGTYNFVFTITDHSGLVTSTETTVIVDEMPDFQEMYLADVFTVAELNSDVFGVPVIMDKISSHTYELKYYSDKENKEILFIPQHDDFSPHCFGFNDEDKLTYAESLEGLKKIILSNVGYYNIVINVKDRTFNAELITPDMPKESYLCIASSNFDGRPNWNLDYQMNINENNYEVSDTFTANEEAQFCVTTTGWAKVWTPYPSNGPQVVFKERVNSSDSNYWLPSAGKYEFMFDYFTGRAVLKKIN